MTEIAYFPLKSYLMLNGIMMSMLQVYLNAFPLCLLFFHLNAFLSFLLSFVFSYYCIAHFFFAYLQLVVIRE
jgi:hypothetical protein